MTAPAAGRRVSAILATALLLLLVAALAPAAAAQRDPLLALDLARIDGTVTPGGGMRLVAEVRNDSTRRREGLRLSASVHPRVISRYAFHRALDEGELGAPLAEWSVDVDPVGPGTTARLGLRRTADELTPVTGQGPGVFPLELGLVDDGAVVDTLTTAIVVTPAEVEQPLRIGVVVPLEPPPPDGDPLLDRDDRAALTALATELDRGTPVTVALDGYLLDEAVRQASAGAPPGGTAPAGAAGWSDLLGAAGGLSSAEEVEVITRPYAAADLTALVRGGMADVAVEAVQASRTAVARHSGVEPDDRTVWPAAGVDGPTLERLVEDGVETVVLAEDHLAIPPVRDLPTSPAPVRTLDVAGGSVGGGSVGGGSVGGGSVGGGSVVAVVPDPWLSDALQTERRRSAAAAAQRLLAETAVVYFERPFAVDPRGVVVAGQPGTASAQYTPALLDGIAASPWLVPVTATQLLAEVPPDDSPAELATPGTPRTEELAPDYVAALRRAGERLAGIASSIEGEDGAFEELSTDLAVAASVWYRDPVANPAGWDRIHGVEEAVDAVERAITVADLPVTLASVEGELPVTLRSDAAVPLRVRVSAASQRYEFVGGPEQQVVLEPGGATTVLFGVRARAPGGTHPVRVTVTDDGGAVVLAQGTLVVRSTAVSVAALAITVGAALFLAAWWFRDARRRRRARDTPAPVPVPAGPGERR